MSTRVYKHKKLTKLFSSHLYANNFVSLPTNYKCNHVLPRNTAEKRITLNIPYNHVELSARRRRSYLFFFESIGQEEYSITKSFPPQKFYQDLNRRHGLVNNKQEAQEQRGLCEHSATVFLQRESGGGRTSNKCVFTE